MRTQADVCAAETDFDADEGRLTLVKRRVAEVVPNFTFAD